MNWSKSSQCVVLFAVVTSVAGAQDTDMDGIPNSWEVAHYMNPDDASDAVVDFDRDGLSAYQEYQLDLLSKGSGPLGEWTVTSLVLPGTPVALNNLDQILVQGANKAFVRNPVDGTWLEISKVGGNPATMMESYGLNDSGQVVGKARHASVNGGQEFGFIKDIYETTSNNNVTPWYRNGIATEPVKVITDINNSGDVIGTDSNGKAFLQSGNNVVTSPPTGWGTTAFTALNNLGLALGVETSSPNFYCGHFLISEGATWHTGFPGSSAYPYGWVGGNGLDEEGYPVEDFGENASFTPTLLNDRGQFAGHFRLQRDYEIIAEGSWYYDGTTYYDGLYHKVLPPLYKSQRILALNNWPQIIASGVPIESDDPETIFQAEGGRSAILHVGGTSMPLEVIMPGIIGPYEKVGAALINDRSTILVSVEPSGAGNTRYYLIKLNNDRDGDGLPNDWEDYYGLDPDDASDAILDMDSDGYTNLGEFGLGGDPGNASSHSGPATFPVRASLDTDSDGLPDDWERKYFPSLTLAQCSPTADPDGDYLSNIIEWRIGSDPTQSDSDNDDLLDYEEFYFYGTQAASSDSDGDGIWDGDELLIGTSPSDSLSTGAPPTFLQVMEKVSKLDWNIHFDEVWAQWRYDQLTFHLMKPANQPTAMPDYPSLSEVFTAHENLNYGAFTRKYPMTLTFPEGDLRMKPELFSGWNTDGFMGGSFPQFRFYEEYPGSDFHLDSWLVRAERKIPHLDPFIQNWLAVETDYWTGDVVDVRPFQLEIEAGQMTSPNTKEIKPSGNMLNVHVNPVAVVEMAPKMKDENGVDINGSEKPFALPRTNGMVEENPSVNRIAHRELKVNIGQNLEGKKVTWSMEAGFTPNGETTPRFRGDWSTAATNHRNRFEASTTYGTYGFELLSQSQGRTTVEADGHTAIRVNVPPWGLNIACVSIQIEGAATPFRLIDLQVPGIVVIDPGHGLGDGGGSNDFGGTGVATGAKEHDFALDVGTRMATELRRRRDVERLPLKIFMTRTDTTNRTFAERTAVARENGCDVYVSVHFNDVSSVPLRRHPFGMWDSTGNHNLAQDQTLAVRLRQAGQAAIATVVPAASRDAPTDGVTSQTHEANLQKGLDTCSDSTNAVTPNFNGNIPGHTPCRAALIELEWMSNEKADILFNEGNLNLGVTATRMRKESAERMAGAVIEDLYTQPAP